MLSFRRVYRSICILTFFATAQVASAIYINPLHPDGAAKAGRIPVPGTNDPYTAVGQMEKIVDAGTGFCTATLIESKVQKTAAQGATPDPWVLTAAHCVSDGDDGPIIDDTAAGLRPRGRYFDSNGAPATRDLGANIVPKISSDRVRRHPQYNFPEFDVGLFRLAPSTNAEKDAIAAAGRLGIRREALNANKPAVGEEMISIGLGSSNVIPGTVAPRWEGDGAGGLARADKRWFTAPITGAGGGASSRFEYAQPGNATDANPTRHNCKADSGGPDIFPNSGGLIGGVHSGVTDDTCSGVVNLTHRDANVTLPVIHNWIDSYTQKAIFWDSLRIVDPIRDDVGEGGRLAAAILDDFTNDANNDGLDDDWAVTNLPANSHPIFTDAITSAGWKYIEGAGPDQIFDGDARSQGEWLTGANTVSVIKRTFTFEEPVILVINQSWNSLGVATDFGVQLDNGQITWSGYNQSAEGNLDAFQERSGTTVAGQVTVYLLNAPEPASLALLLGGGLLLRRRQKR